MLDDYGDELHQPDDRDRRGIQHDGSFISRRGLINLGSLTLVCVGILTLLWVPLSTLYHLIFNRVILQYRIPCDYVLHLIQLRPQWLEHQCNRSNTGHRELWPPRQGHANRNVQHTIL